MVRSTPVALPSPTPSPIRKNPTVGNTDNVTPVPSPSTARKNGIGNWENYFLLSFLLGGIAITITYSGKILRGTRNRLPLKPRPLVYPRKNKTVTNTDNVTASQIQDAESYYERGNKHREREEFEQAIAEYNQAIQLNPKYAYAYHGRGTVYEDQGKYDLAIAEYNQAIQLDPKFAYAYMGRGNTYSDQGKYDLAIADYNQAIQLNPKYADAYNNRGNVYDDQGKYCLLYTSPSPRDPNRSRMPSSA